MNHVKKFENLNFCVRKLTLKEPTVGINSQRPYRILSLVFLPSANRLRNKSGLLLLHFLPRLERLLLVNF